MNNVARIDISKGKSVVSFLRPFVEVGAKPFLVDHTGYELKTLANYLKSLDSEARVVMEHTGRYYEQVARFPHEGASLSVRSIPSSLRLREQHPAQSENRQGGCSGNCSLWA